MPTLPAAASRTRVAPPRRRQAAARALPPAAPGAGPDALLARAIALLRATPVPPLPVAWPPGGAARVG